MFNIKFAEYKSHDLVFLLNEDSEVWFVIRHSLSQNHVDSVAFGEGSYAINTRHNGNVNAFIDNEIIPKVTAKIRSFFGEDAGLPDPNNWQAVLKHFAQHGVVFKENPSRIERK